MKKTYYHGTSIQNAEQILKDGKIKTNRLGYVSLCESINDCKTYYQMQNLPYLLEEESQKEMAYFALVLDDESVIDNDESCINIDRLIKLSGIDKRCFINTLGTKRYVSKITRDDLYMCRDTILNKSEMVFHLYGCDDFMNKYVSDITELSNEVDINTYYRNSLKYFHVHGPKYGVYKYTKNPKQLYVSFVLDNYDFNKLCVLLIILSMMCDNYNFSMFNYLRSNGLCYSVNRRYIECTNRIVANLIIDVSPDKCEITKDYVAEYINNFKLIANNDNIEYAIRKIKLNDRLNIMNIEDYHDAYISFVRSRFNGVMDLYKSYDNISVDDVMDMIKDITENRLIIQYCSL